MRVAGNHGTRCFLGWALHGCNLEMPSYSSTVYKVALLASCKPPESLLPVYLLTVGRERDALLKGLDNCRSDCPGCRRRWRWPLHFEFDWQPSSANPAALHGTLPVQDPSNGRNSVDHVLSQCRRYGSSVCCRTDIHRWVQGGSFTSLSHRSWGSRPLRPVGSVAELNHAVSKNHWPTGWKGVRRLEKTWAETLNVVLDMGMTAPRTPLVVIFVGDRPSRQLVERS
ncbi:hypothetical protein B0I37DRAFT_171886 [Chaetomium sp. MPI-CAGE-AT-0009]|nr:hypothetical protein B0I37DRAFT_171886 [Chaetomium sp. MPI-CAGE-AT-0009]